MLNVAATARAAVRSVARAPTSARSYHATAVVRFPTTGPSAPPQGHSASEGNTTSPTASASEHNAGKAPQQEAQETAEMAAGMEAADAKYGAGNMVEGNFTKGSQQQKEREAAAKQGEK